MACSKYTLTNTGTTSINFNYRRCDDSMWEYQVNLDPNQTKNIWLINGTYQIAEAFQANVSLVNDGAYPLTPTPTPTTTTTPTPTSTTTPTPTPTTTTTPTPSITPTTTVTPTVTSTVTPTTTVTPTVTSTVTPSITPSTTTTVTPTVTSTNTPTPSITPTTTVTPTITTTPTPTSTPVGPGSMYVNGNLEMVPGFTGSTSDFSIEFWFKSSNNPSTYEPIMGNFFTNTNSLSIVLDANNLYVSNGASSPAQYITFPLPSTLSANTWNYFAISRSGTTESVWLNGVASTNNSQTDSRNYTGMTNALFTTGGLLVSGNVTDIKVNIGSTPFDPSLSTITVPTTSLGYDVDTVILMNCLYAAAVFADSAGIQTINLNQAPVVYSIESPY